MRTTIKGAGGKVLAYFDDQGDVITALSAGGAVLGRYYKSRNQTLTAGGSLIGYGNLLANLIER